MAYEQIMYTVSDRIATITLNRPDRLNAWTPLMSGEVRNAMDKAAADDGVRVIVLTGAGRGFCSGADMADLQNATEQGASAVPEEMRAGRSHESQASVRPDFTKSYSYFPSVPKPVIAAVNGPAAGLGLIIALFCDLRFASDKARFTTAFSRRGLIAEYGLSWILPRVIGLPNALDLLLSARMIDAAEALRMGLVHQVFNEEDLLEGVRVYALELANAASPRSLRVIKRQTWEGQIQTLAEAIEMADKEMLLSIDSEDFREGVAHFMEKRPPAFTGR